ncbi:MAG: hypothetical protein KGN79_16175 [Acidobacteriota bacterium]|nr:hypothetical protein [Acidobacteriota bacterium]
MFSPSHFTALSLFALFSSIVFSITQRETPKQMVRYFIYCFALFELSAIVLSWLMYLIAK